jgi:hypothetical protein
MKLANSLDWMLNPNNEMKSKTFDKRVPFVESYGIQPGVIAANRACSTVMLRVAKLQ